MRKGGKVLVATLLTAGVYLSSQGQGPASTSQAQSPVLRIQARDVIVDLVVTQDSGEPVNGLHAGDFRILEDGKPQTIDFFEEHTAGSLPASALQPLPRMPPGVYTNVPPAPENDSVNVLLLDSLNTPPQMVSFARNQILSYLNHVKPGTRLAIFTLNNKLSMVQGFTSDAALLRDFTIKQTGPGFSSSLVTKSEIGAEQTLEAFLIENSNAPAASGNSPVSRNPTIPMNATNAVAAAFESYQSFKQAVRTRMTLEALSDVARYLAGVPGRKNLIWFAGDFPVVILPKLDQRMEATDVGIALSEVRKAADLLTAARVAVYPVYANGMMTEDMLSADNRGIGSAAGIGKASSMDVMGVWNTSNTERASEIAAINQIASDTGGKAVYNTNDLDSAIGRSVADGAHYYTVVYSPRNKKMDGRYRSVEVKLNGGKYKLAYRRGYNADELPPANAAPPSNALQPLMVRGMPSSTQILYGVRVVLTSPQPAATAPHAGKNAQLAGPLRRYSVDFMIRWSDLRFDTAAVEKRTGKIEVEMVARDGNGKAVNWTGGTEMMNLPQEAFASIQKSGVPAHFEIDLPADKDVVLATGVYDLETGKAGTLEISLPLNPGTEVAAQAATTSN